MGVGRLRGGGQLPPPIKPLTAKPEEGGGLQKALQKALDGVLRAGQNILLPARTGLSQFPDHFDARQLPDYDKLLKGTAEHPDNAELHAGDDALEQPPDPGGAVDLDGSGAMSLLDVLPQLVPPPVPMARAHDAEGLDDTEDAENPGGREHRNLEPDDGGDDADFADPEAPELEPRHVELQVGVFTLDEGSVDVRARRLCTLEAFLDGDVPFVSCAVDLHAIPEGAELSIPALDAAAGRAVRLRALHQNARTEGVGSAYLEVCVSEPGAWAGAFAQLASVRIG